MIIVWEGEGQTHVKLQFANIRPRKISIMEYFKSDFSMKITLFIRQLKKMFQRKLKKMFQKQWIGPRRDLLWLWICI